MVPFIIPLYSPRVIKLESGGLMQFPRFPHHVWICTELLINVTVWLQGLQLRIIEVGGKWFEKRGVVVEGEGNKTKTL